MQTAPDSSENHRRSLEQFILVSLVVLTGFAVTHWLLGFHAQSIIQGTIAATLPPIYQWLRRGGSTRVAGHLAAAYSLIVFTSLYVAPTINNTGIIWLVAYPLIVFFFVGTRLGLIWCLVYFILLAGISLLQFLGLIVLPYSIDQILFTLIQLLLFGIVSFYYVNDRERAEALLLQAKQQSEAADHAKSEFLSVMSHELRTPIHGIIGMQELLAADTSRLSDEQRECLALAQQATKSLRELVNDILDLSKVEAGAIVLEQREFDLTDSLKQAIIPFIVTCHQKGLKLELQTQNIPARIIGDAMRLKQILINLIGNAVKFTSEGHIRLLVKGQGNELFFCVEDTGVGISQRDIDRIFSPFVQGENAANARQQGTGLGMSIVKRFVDLMGGTIDITSVPQVGTRFNFRLPCQTASDRRLSERIDSTEIHPDPHDNDNPAEQMSHFRILLAEDDPIGQRIASKRLRRAGIDTEVASTGLEAWEMYLAGSFDVLLTDVRMPDLNGMELARRIRTHEQEYGRQRLLIIGLSAFALEDIIRDCLEAGMDDFITKPIDPNTLLTRVTALQQQRNNGLPATGDQ